MNGNGEAVEIINIPAPNSNDKFDMLISWVEENKVPAKTLVVSSDGRIGAKPEGKGYILCSYPNFPRYTGGPEDQVSSYTSSSK